MIRAIGEEVRRAFRMTFGEGVRAAMRQGKSHPAWFADPHLRKGYLTGLPLFVLGVAMTFVHLWSVGPRFLRSPWTLMAWTMPGAILANLVWFTVAAHSRRRAG